LAAKLPCNERMTFDSPQTCRLCGGTFTVRALVEGLTHFWREVDVAVAEAPCCRATEELRIVNGRVERGYVYAAGAPHFCGMEVYEVPGLRGVAKGDALVFELDGVRRDIPRKR
jgi:hypothetical protein